MEVRRYARDGYTIIFIGHHDHDEAVGTVGEAPESIIVVESPEEVEKLEVPDPDRLAFVTQTTLSVSDAVAVISALKKKFPNIRQPDKEDICYATTNRQAAVNDFSSDADVVLVVGSQNSSNSRRLVETAHIQGKPAYLIDDDSELNPEWLAGKNKVLITAGASAPEHLVQNLIDRLRREYNASVETRTLVQEDISFELPKSVRTLTVLN
jgi:4-hydroxy-3-methylbut-2-enyl diphosphate reductase